ncbi:metalloprotease [Coemansia sp. 'formosensis']|nr:metalloprotease [Coemansia sp. 'formosensis']
MHSTETNYYFSVFNGALKGALDRFAQFFISPLFNADCVDRELKAVDSEHKGYLQSDSWRIYRLVSETSNPAHPYSGFNVGNTETLKGAAEELGLDLREELIKFYQKYYSADIMRLVVIGNHSLDVLSEWVASKFSDIKSKGNTKPTFEGHPIGKAQLGKLIHYKTVCEMYELKLQFPLPELMSIYGEKPTAYINSLFDHKESGSIYSVLSKNGWATATNGGSICKTIDGSSIYVIEITATPEGLENYEAIVSIIFGYIKMLVETGPQEWYYKELSLVSKAEFDFKDKEDAENYVCSLSSDGHNQYIPPQHILSHSSLMRRYDADLISKCLSYLNPGNYRLFVGAQEHRAVECKLEEKYYGILHHIADLPSHMMSNVECSHDVAKMLHLPERNPFLPENLSGLQAHIESIFDKAYVKMLVTGNYDQSVALDVSNQVLDILKLQPGESNPVYVTQRINQFIHKYRKELQELTIEEFESSVQSLISIKQEKLKSINDEYSQMWAHIKSDRYSFGKLDDEIEHLKQLNKDDLLAFWDKYINEDTAQRYTRLDMQMWSTKIWQLAAEEFEMYPSTVLALFGCLRSGGHTALSIADVQSFVSSASPSSSIDSLLSGLSELYVNKQVPSVSDEEEPKVIFESSSKIATALQMAIDGINEPPKFAALSKTNFANIDMKQSPEGIWFIHDYKQFQRTQALNGMPVPTRKLVPPIPEPALAEGS